MKSRAVGVVIVAAMLVGQSGCAMIGSTRNVASTMWHSFKPNPTDYRDSTDEINDQWSSVGREGRGDRPLEQESDPLKAWLMSSKARNIERNLGVE